MQVVGYTFDADTWCKSCLPVSTRSLEVGAIFATDEWDYDVHCNACGELLLWVYKECIFCKQEIEEDRLFDTVDSTYPLRYKHDDCGTCIVCKHDIQERQHIVQDFNNNLMHWICFLDTVPADIHSMEDYMADTIMEEWEHFTLKNGR